MDKIKLRILITGGTGFVGSALLKSLISCDCYSLRATYRGVFLNSNCSVEWISMPDLSLNPDWTEALKGVDVVIHLAARAHILKDNLSDPLTKFRNITVQPTKKLANQAVLSGV
jgi:nucleoside-diphosphate-sugar epimerase